MTHKFAFGQPVTVTGAPDIAMIVLKVEYSPTGVEYLLSWWSDGKEVKEWFAEWRISSA